MNKPLIGQWILAFVLWLAAAAGHTQDDATGDPEPTPEFEVEVIIFEYVGGVVGAREDWGYIDTGRAAVQAQLEQEQSLNDHAQESDASSGAAAQTSGERSAGDKPLVWTRIANDQRRLTETFQRLRNSRDYRPLVHAAWRQPVYGQADATTLALERVSTTPQSLGASASIYVERFLHLTLDLELAKAGAGDAEGLGSVVYRLNEKRKMRSGETHFFDHPRFGAIALISKPTDTLAAN